MRRIIFLVYVVCLVICAVDVCRAQVPQIINYQGILTDAGGNVVADNNYVVTFRLYTSAASAEPVWTESQSVTVVNGLINVYLGSVTPLSLAFDAPYFLGVQIGDGSELSPRTPLSASPYSLRARSVDAGHVVTSINNLKDEVFIEAGGNVNIDTNDGRIIISSTGVESHWRITEGIQSPNIVGGHPDNSVDPDKLGQTISGGGRDVDQFDEGPNRTADHAATISGGIANTAGGMFSTVGGGAANNAVGERSTISGGTDNIAEGGMSTVAGGWHNHAIGEGSTVSGGTDNSADNTKSTVGGGFDNHAVGNYSTVPGGHGNVASGEYSFAAGRRVFAGHNGTFVWGDATDATIQSSAANQFTVRSSGGVRFFSDASATIGVELAPSGNQWTSLSDRNSKMDFTNVDYTEILTLLMQVPVTTWRYRVQNDENVRHMGPVAQDFYDAFGLGSDNLRIGSLDVGGVALAAIKGIFLEIEKRDILIEALEERLNDLEIMIGGRQR